MRHDITAERIREIGPKGLILSGGPASVYETGAPQCDPEIFRPRHSRARHLLRHAAGLPGRSAARCSRRRRREFGRAPLPGAPSTDGLFAGVPDETVVWMSHGDQVADASGDFVPLAATDTCPVAAVRHRTSADLRPAVPSRGQPHAARAAEILRQLPVRRLRLPRHVAAGRLRPRRPSTAIRAPRRRATA